MFSQYNKGRCTGNCTNCPLFSGNTRYLSNSISSDYSMQVNSFVMNIPQTIFGYDNMGICHTQYEWLQDYLIEYCRKNYPWKTSVYMEVNFEKTVLVSDNYTYEKYIKEIFKTAIDIAAEITQDKNPQQSIVFDGIGIVLADDVKEAVKKVISILEKATKVSEL